MGNERQRVPALRVHQWLSEWNRVPFDTKARRTQPRPDFFLLALPASSLKALSGIERRSAATGTPRALDLGIQRLHDRRRSKEIREYVQFGYPWGELSPRQRKNPEYSNLRKPGWLPTAIVVNVLTSADERRGEGVHTLDLIRVVEEGAWSFFELPANFSASTWSPRARHPIEVIDGQHRLWAFEDWDVGDDYYLPVVAFVGLDLSWQAYLFYTINIKPKRINPSLAFDLFPLLRTEDWLESFGLRVYRETRAQELTEALWAFPEGPWYQRINMLGEPATGGVTQAAWVRSLLATYVKSFEGPGVRLGGLFGAPIGVDAPALPWSRAQQAAFLLQVWQRIREAVDASAEDWARALRPETAAIDGWDPAFAGEQTLLNTDQGVRGVLHVSNDLSYILAEGLRLAEWLEDPTEAAVDLVALESALDSLRDSRADRFFEELSEAIVTFDWRTSAAPGLTEEERTLKSAFRGSGGYATLRRTLLAHLSKRGNARLKRAANEALARLLLK